MLAIEEELPTDKVKWYIASGVTSHITNRGYFYIGFEQFKGLHIVTVGNGEIIEAVGMATLAFKPISI